MIYTGRVSSDSSDIIISELNIRREDPLIYILSFGCPQMLRKKIVSNSFQQTNGTVTKKLREWLFDIKHINVLWMSVWRTVMFVSVDSQWKWMQKHSISMVNWFTRDYLDVRIFSHIIWVSYNNSCAKWISKYVLATSLSIIDNK